MKILHVIPSVGPWRGGPSFAMRAIAGGLAGRGIETHVATTDDNGPGRLDVTLGQPITEDGAVYWYFRRQTPFYLCSIPFAIWLWRHASDYSLIHIHALFSWCSNVAALIARRKGVPYVIRPLGVLNRWGMENRRPLLKRLSFALIEKRVLRHAAFIQYTAELERAEAAECGFKDNPMIIPNPVESADGSGSAPGEHLRARYPELRGRRIVLFLSRIDRKKGLDLLIPAFHGVLKSIPDAALVIAGDGDRELIETIRNQCRALAIENSVYWPGFLDGDAKRGAFGEAEVFVLPSYSENFGIAVIEAMAAAVPVIITDQVGICREVGQGKAGLVISTAFEPLRNAMVRLLSDEPFRATLGQNAMKLARTQFAPGVVIDKLLNSYASVLMGAPLMDAPQSAPAE
ncbi:MAG TPA: glycosyltransferase [Bryobacteraceae bacterium]|jgi:glycosyltransferase involved in cell wall biosynthesis|nr:glycosyltransferase [Bryobacteraceae bacterium]